MDNYRYSLFLFGVVALAILGIAVLVWINYSFLSLDIMSQEFLILWIRVRQLLMEGISPYEGAVSHGFQLPPGAIDVRERYFTYPFYTVFFVSPFAALGDYILAKVAWMTALEIAILGMVIYRFLFQDGRSKRGY